MAHSRSSSTIFWLAILLSWLGHTAPAAAQAPTPPLDLDIERMYSIRSEGPITLRVRMTPRDTALIEGRLEFRLMNGNDLLGTSITNDEIINPPSKTVRYVLPGAESSAYSQQLDLQVDFVTPKQRRFRFPLSSLIVPKYRDRELVVGIVTPGNRSSSAEIDALLQGLKFELFIPDGPNKIPIDKTVHTLLSNLAPDQLPPDATSYCSFNMLFIAAEGFAAMRESQWPSLLDWVEAGGSLCLMPGTNLSVQHVALLNGLLKHRTEKTTFLLGPNNDLVSKDEDSGKRSILLRRGLGQIAIVPLQPDQPIDPASEMWRSVANHLWKVRRDQRLGIVTSGKWSEEVPNRQDAELKQGRPEYNYYRSARDRDRLTHIPLGSGDGMVQSIMPSDLRIIPLSLIAFILFLYVLAIGPGDYFILGRLKMRKWTWVTFPVTTIVFAGGALWMAEWYMNTGDARRSIYFVDIGVEGNPERTTQLEMLFNSRQKVVETQVKRGLFTPLNHQDYGAGSFQSMNRQRGIGGAELGSKTPELTGRYPTNYTARQLTPKWVPQLNRITSVLSGSNAPTKESDPAEKEEPTEYPWPKPEIDWRQFEFKETPEWPRLANDQGWKKSIVDPILAKYPSEDVVIYALGGGTQIQLHGSHPLFSPTNSNNSPYQQVAVATRQFSNGQGNFLADVSMLQDGGLFGVVSAIAPHGGRQLEDLTLVDPSDPRQWLLVVGIADDLNWIVYRKLYAGIE
jgi:hypothetical protein